jgi:hypothetical protein
MNFPLLPPPPGKYNMKFVQPSMELKLVHWMVLLMVHEWGQLWDDAKEPIRRLRKSEEATSRYNQ